MVEFVRAIIFELDSFVGLAGLWMEIRQAGMKIAVISSGPDEMAMDGFQDHPDVFIHRDEAISPKLAADCYLQAARALNIPPAQCVVVTASDVAVIAAHGAGMVVVGLGSSDDLSGVEVILPGIESITLADLTYAATYWVSEPVFETARQRHRETIFVHGNGYLCTRGSFEERLLGDRQATLIHGMWDKVPVSFTELANAPDWAALEIWVDGQRFDMSVGQIEDYARYLDLRTGVLQRRLCWSPEPGKRIELRFARFASLADEHLLALRVQVTPLDGPADVRLRAVLDSHVENEGILHWRTVSQDCAAGRADLTVRTRHTGKTLAMSMQVAAQIGDHAAGPKALTGLDCPGCPGVELVASVLSGETLVFDKFMAVFTSRDTQNPLSDAQHGVHAAARSGYEALLRDQESAWAEFWAQSDVTIKGDDEAQLALRHALFQLRIAAPTHDEHTSMGAKTLSGFGYRGHIFWDNEIFVLPFFTYTQPHIARNMLRYRYHSLPGARRKAAANGFAGAQFPWESAETGDEVTPTWVPHFADPTQLVRIWTGDIQIHISADIAYAMRQFWQVSGDDNFWREVGIPVLLETAVFWGERAEPEGDHFSIRDVIGPDENHDHVDNNQYTNYMVRWHLRTALEALQWLDQHDPDRRAALILKLDLDPERLTQWQRVIDGLVLFHDPATGLIEQFEGYHDLKDVDWPAFKGRTKSMQELLGIEGCTEYKALKQADVIALLCLLGDQFDEKTWRANWDYYVPVTDHEYGSSLGPSMHAWAACRMGLPEEAYEHFMRAARADLLDVRGNANDGIHAASAGGQWEAVVFGFAGMRLTDSGPTFQPRFPAHWKRVAFNILYRGEQFRFDFKP